MLNILLSGKTVHARKEIKKVGCKAEIITPGFQDGITLSVPSESFCANFRRKT